MSIPSFALGIHHLDHKQRLWVSFLGINASGETMSCLEHLRTYTNAEAQQHTDHSHQQLVLWSARDARICLALQAMGARWEHHSAHQKLEAIRRAEAYALDQPA